MKSIVVVFRELNAPDNKPCEKIYVFGSEIDIDNDLIEKFVDEVRKKKELIDENTPNSEDWDWNGLSWDERIDSVVRMLLNSEKYSSLRLIKTDCIYFIRA